jgi:hypothetical protein
VRWFLWAGCIGLAMAILITVLNPSSPEIILVLWPASIVGLADPKGLFDQAVFGLFMFGGNFLLYGAFGAIAGLAADRLQG